MDTAPTTATAATSASTGCPYHASASVDVAPELASGPAPQRSRADQFVRRILFIKDRPRQVSKRAAETAFQRSMLISATRCTLTYIVFPFVLPAFGIATSVGPALGLTIGVLALVCDVFSIRRFFAADHRWRWHFTVVALCVITLLMVLLVEDVIDLIT